MKAVREKSFNDLSLVVLVQQIHFHIASNNKWSRFTVTSQLREREKKEISRVKEFRQRKTPNSAFLDSA